MFKRTAPPQGSDSLTHHTLSTAVPPWAEVKGGGSQRLNTTPEANPLWRGVPVDSEQRCMQPPGQRAGRCPSTVAQPPVTSVELRPVLGRTQAACLLSRDPPRPPLTPVLGKRSPTQLQLCPWRRLYVGQTHCSGPGCLRNQALPSLTQVVPVTPLESTNPD